MDGKALGPLHQLCQAGVGVRALNWLAEPLVLQNNAAQLPSLRICTSTRRRSTPTRCLSDAQRCATLLTLHQAVTQCFTCILRDHTGHGVHMGIMPEDACHRCHGCVRDAIIG